MAFARGHHVNLAHVRRDRVKRAVRRVLRHDRTAEHYRSRAGFGGLAHLFYDFLNMNRTTQILLAFALCVMSLGCASEPRKFGYLDKVTITTGFYENHNGRILDYDKSISGHAYTVKLKDKTLYYVLESKLIKESRGAAHAEKTTT